jgi:hypothetical protein
MDAEVERPKRLRPKRPIVAPESAIYYTPEQVAAMLQVSVRSIYRLVVNHHDMPVLK